MYEFIDDKPRCTEADYKQRYNEEVVLINGSSYGKLYKGTGISVAEHPYNDRCRMKAKCANCESSNVEVICASWGVNVGTGDAKMYYELHCMDCEKYTTRGMDD